MRRKLPVHFLQPEVSGHVQAASSPAGPASLGLVFDVFFIEIASHAGLRDAVPAPSLGGRAFSAAGPGAMFSMWLSLGLVPPRHMAWFSEPGLC